MSYRSMLGLAFAIMNVRSLQSTASTQDTDDLVVDRSFG